MIEAKELWSIIGSVEYNRRMTSRQARNAQPQSSRTPNPGDAGSIPAGPANLPKWGDMLTHIASGIEKESVRVAKLGKRASSGSRYPSPDLLLCRRCKIPPKLTKVKGLPNKIVCTNCGAFEPYTAAQELKKIEAARLLSIEFSGVPPPKVEHSVPRRRHKLLLRKFLMGKK